MKEDAMANEFSSEDVRDVWQKQNSESFRMSLDEIRKRSELLDNRIRRRNLIGLAIGFFEVVWFSVFVFIVPNLVHRIGYFLLALGCGYLVYQLLLNKLQKRATVVRAGEMGNKVSIEFYRAELGRQRDFHRGSRFWSRMVMLAIGPLVFFGFAIAHPQSDRFLWLVVSALLLLLLIRAVPLNLRRAQKYQAQIKELDALQWGPR
jgi:hypothetical protein